MPASDITWHEGTVSRADRAALTGGVGATLWFTGLSGSGKSTVATATEERLVAMGRAAYRLDGDNLRTGINADLGFSRDERLENCRRVAEVARLFADAGQVAIVAVIRRAMTPSPAPSSVRTWLAWNRTSPWSTSNSNLPTRRTYRSLTMTTTWRL